MFLLVPAALVAFSPAAPPARPPKDTNFLILLADDLGFGDPGYQGGRALTPHLDAMARGTNSLAFNRFYCGGAVCSPTRASILTGRTPNRVCIWDYINRNDHMHLPHNEFTVGHAGRAAGHRTGHFGKWHLGHFAKQEPAAHNGTLNPGPFNLTTPAHVGFDTYYSAMPLFEVSTTFNCGCFDPDNNDGQCIEGHWGKPGGCDFMHTGNGTDPDTVGPDATPMVKEGYGADNAKLLVDHFEVFATESVAAHKSFVALIWFQNVHVQYTATEEFTSLYPVGPTITQAQQDFWGSLSAMDAQVGRCRRILTDLAVAEDTFVLFTSDNGPEVGQPGVTRGLVGRKRDFTEGGIRMPTLLEWPRMISTNHNVTAFPAVSNDILPTVLDVLGIQSTHPSWTLDGISLLPLITNPTLAVRGTPIGHATGQVGDAFPAGFPSGGVVGPAPPQANGALGQHQLAWTDEHMKIWAHVEAGQWMYRLFNISDDWYEQHDLSKELPDTLTQMQRDLTKWYTSVLESSSSAENNCRASQGPRPSPGPPATPMPPSGTVVLNASNMLAADSCGLNNSKTRETCIGKFESHEGCKAACKAHPDLCVTWTWHKDTADNGCYASECFLRATDYWNPALDRPVTDCGVR